jgi:hypothetical protein
MGTAHACDYYTVGCTSRRIELVGLYSSIKCRTFLRFLPSERVSMKRFVRRWGHFHGVYIFSYLTSPYQGWVEHFRFARAAAAYKIQHLGNEAGLPTLADVEATRREFEDRS